MFNKSAHFLSSTTAGTKSPMTLTSAPSPPGGSGCGQQLFSYLKSVLTRPGISLFDRICEINRLILPSVSSLQSTYQSDPKPEMPTYTPRDLDPVFVLIMQDIFGSAHVKSDPGGGGGGAVRYPVSNAHHSGWGLCGITRNKHYRDFNAALSFLCSGGTVMQLVEFLSHDASCAFEFPVSKLPFGLQHHRHPQQQHRHPVMQNKDGEAVVMLSPFEFFIFHYVSVATLGPEWNQAAGIVENDSLYPVIFEDYLASFLAMGGAAFKTHDRTLVRQPLQSSPTSSRPTLLKADLLLHHAAAPRPAAFAPGLGPGNGPSSEAWKSNVFVDAVSQFWVNACQHRVGVPSSDVVKLVRMFIKHTHYFFNSFHPSQVFNFLFFIAPRLSICDHFRSFQHDLRDSLRQGTFAGFFGGLRTFFEYLIDHWPLDASFRLVLETWLSYIQPWRYRDPTQPERGDGAGGQFNPALWGRYLSDHAEFYDALLKKMILRFLRLDLSCNKNAFMLFRLCKVLSQDGLPEALKVVIRDGGGGGGGAGAVRSSFVSGTAEGSQSDEGERGSVFDADFAVVANNLAMKTLEAKRTLMEQRRNLTWKRPKTGGSKEENWFTIALVYLLELSKNQQDTENAAELDELDKTVMHIAFCTERLLALFELPINVGEVMASLSMSSGFGRDSPLGKKVHDESEPLTPQMRWDIINRATKYSPKIESFRNPDEVPLRSDECHILARLLHKISLKINARFPAIAERYEEPGVVGAILRQMCHPPTSYTILTKHSLVRAEHRLPARLVLRPLASHKLLAYIALVFAFNCLFGHRTVLRIAFIIFTFWAVKLFYTMVTESRERVSHHSHSD